MSRSGYDEGCDGWDLIRYRGMVASAIRGKRGQVFLKDLLLALDEMPVKKLIKGDLETNKGVCALGAVGRRRGVDMYKIDPYDAEIIAAKFNIAECLAREVAFQNDDFYSQSEENRWQIVREWVASLIKK